MLMIDQNESPVRLLKLRRYGGIQGSPIINRPSPAMTTCGLSISRQRPCRWMFHHLPYSLESKTSAKRGNPPLVVMRHLMESGAHHSDLYST
jgi:hypothetical protein